jgi:hypothetical protein
MAFIVHQGGMHYLSWLTFITRNVVGMMQDAYTHSLWKLNVQSWLGTMSSKKHCSEGDKEMDEG